MQEIYAIYASVPRRPRTRNLEIIKRLDDLRRPSLTLRVLAGTKWYIYGEKLCPVVPSVSSPLLRLLQSSSPLHTQTLRISSLRARSMTFTPLLVLCNSYPQSVPLLRRAIWPIFSSSSVGFASSSLVFLPRLGLSLKLEVSSMSSKPKSPQFQGYRVCLESRQIFSHTW